MGAIWRRAWNRRLQRYGAAGLEEHLAPGSALATLLAVDLTERGLAAGGGTVDRRRLRPPQLRRGHVGKPGDEHREHPVDRLGRFAEHL